jgi:hypothetical protein
MPEPSFVHCMMQLPCDRVYSSSAAKKITALKPHTIPSKDGKAALRGGFSVHIGGKQVHPKHSFAPDIETSRRRAQWLRQLAEGTGDLEFLERLKDLTEEYDDLAEPIRLEDRR